MKLFRFLFDIYIGKFNLGEGELKVSHKKIISFHEKNQFQLLSAQRPVVDLAKTVLQHIESTEKFKKLPLEKQKESRALFTEVMDSLPYFDRMVELAKLLVHETMLPLDSPDKIAQALQKINPSLWEFYRLNQRLEKEPVLRSQFQDLMKKLPEKEQVDVLQKLLPVQGSLSDVIHQAETQYLHFIPAIQDTPSVRQPLMHLSKNIQFNTYDDIQLLFSDGTSHNILSPLSKPKTEPAEKAMIGGGVAAVTGLGALYTSIFLASVSNPIATTLAISGGILYVLGFIAFATGALFINKSKHAEQKMLADTDLPSSGKEHYMALMGKPGKFEERKNNPGDLRILIYSHQQALRLIPKTQKEIHQKIKTLKKTLKKASAEASKQLQAQLNSLKKKLTELTQEKEKRKKITKDLIQQRRSILKSVQHLIYQPKSLVPQEIDFLNHLLDPVYVAKKREGPLAGGHKRAAPF